MLSPGKTGEKMAPDVAFAASARDWPDRIHRHMLDHGGARVVARPMGSEQVMAAQFDVLLIDDICSFLTPRLVSLVKERGSGVVGVFDPEDGPDAKRRLLECGISDVIESAAEPEEFLQAVRGATRLEASPPPRVVSKPAVSWSIGAFGITVGVGTTEVAICLARSLSTKLETTLVDLDPAWPSVAARLDLPLHPNLRTAVDLALHDSQPISSAFHLKGELAVVGGLADRGAGGPIPHSELTMMLGEIGSISDVVVGDLGAVADSPQTLFDWFDSLLLVTTGDPVGLSRLTGAIDQLAHLRQHEKLVVVANKTPRSRYHESEVRSELSSVWPDLPVVVIPHDRRVAEAVWAGVVSERGPFVRATARMTQLIERSVKR